MACFEGEYKIICVTSSQRALCKSSHLTFATTQDCQDRAQPCSYLIDLKPRGLTNLFKVTKWQNQELAAKALEDLLQNVAFARAVSHFRFLLVVFWDLSFPLDVFFFFFPIWQCCATLRILVPPGVTLAPPVVAVHGSLTTGLPGSFQEAITFCFIMAIAGFFLSVCFFNWHSSSLHSSEKAEGLSQCQRCGNRWVCRVSPAPWSGQGRKSPHNQYLGKTVPNSARSPLGPLYLLCNCCHLTDDKSGSDAYSSHPSLPPCPSWCQSVYCPVSHLTEGAFVSLAPRHRVGVFGNFWLKGMNRELEPPGEPPSS